MKRLTADGLPCPFPLLLEDRMLDEAEEYRLWMRKLSILGRMPHLEDYDRSVWLSDEDYPKDDR